MTEKEAIEVLEKPSKHIRMVHETKNEMQFYTFSSDLVKAFEMAIQALEEIQQYKEIGTVKEIKIREAQFARLLEGYLIDLSSLREYRAIGAIKEFKALKEKSVAKKVVRRKGALNKYYHEEECPNCKAEFRVHVAGYKYTQAVGETHYCPNCGQKLDWK